MASRQTTVWLELLADWPTEYVREDATPLMSLLRELEAYAPSTFERHPIVPPMLARLLPGLVLRKDHIAALGMLTTLGTLEEYKALGAWTAPVPLRPEVDATCAAILKRHPLPVDGSLTLVVQEDKVGGLTQADARGGLEIREGG